MEGQFPKNQVDHINRTRDDNRWVNLRHATKYQNQANTTKNNPFVGVHFRKDRNRWTAYAKKEGSKINLGNFITNLAACYARHAWEVQHATTS